jgi:isoleucyl-tRNA synthetase
MIVDALARMLATLLVFTADEIWENLPGEGSRAASVHLTELPAASGNRDEARAARWEGLFKVREEVMRALEEARVAKVIGGSLEASVEIVASGKAYELLASYGDNLRFAFIVSQVSLTRTDTGDVSIKVTRAAGQKCERCWNYSTRVGESARYPAVCERCVEALEEIEAG